MNKTIKVKQLVSIMPDSSRIRFYECNYNGDCITLTEIMFVGNKDLYSKYLERHIHFIEVNYSMIRIFI